MNELFFRNWCKNQPSTPSPLLWHVLSHEDRSCWWQPLLGWRASVPTDNGVMWLLPAGSCWKQGQSTQPAGSIWMLGEGREQSCLLAPAGVAKLGFIWNWFSSCLKLYDIGSWSQQWKCTYLCSCDLDKVSGFKYSEEKPFSVVFSMAPICICSGCG